MITENYIHAEGKRYDLTVERKKTKSSVREGETYWCLSQMFQGIFRAECLKVYDHSALVKIIVCEQETDEDLQLQLNHVTVVSFKNMRGV